MADSGSRCVLRTGRLYEAEMVADALRDEGLPFFRREENSSGAEWHMPAAPMVGPGIWFTIWVPADAEARAAEVISRLPVDQGLSPGIWHFSEDAGVKRLFRLLAWVILGLLAAAWLRSLLVPAG